MTSKTRERLEEARRRRERLFIETQNLRAQAGDEPDDGVLERLDNVNTGIANIDAEIRELEDRGRREDVMQRILDSGGEGRTEPGGYVGVRDEPARDTSPAGQARELGLRAIERMSYLTQEAGDRLTDLVERDRSGLDSRYIQAISDPHYERAFAILMQHPQDGHLRMSPQEVEAVRRVSQVSAERAMSAGVPAEGGFAVPATIDPTVILTSSAAVNPLRELATVTTITVSEWRGVTSAGVSASFDAEAEEVSDDSPSLAQPVIRPQKAQAFIPFSIEIGQDWGSFQAEMGRLLRDGRDALEAEKFMLGAGESSNEPEGLLVGGTQVVVTAGSGALAADDIYSTAEALPSRWQPGATWLSSLAVANFVYRIWNPTGTEPPLFNEARDRLLGKAWREASVMSGTIAAGELVAAFGDIGSAFKIVDRIGLSIEIVAHLFGPNRRPSGQRGVFAYWRTSSQVIVPEALRILQVAT